MNWKGFGGSSHGLIQVASQHLLRGLRKYSRASVRIAGVQAEVQTEHLLNKNLEHYCYTILLGY
jgi:hypothetical protein